MSNSNAPNFQADNPRRLKAFEATSSSLDFIQNTHSPFLLEIANKIGSLLFLNKKDLSILDFSKLENLLIKNSRKVATEYEFSSEATRNLTMVKLSPCEKFLAIVSPTHIFVISLADFLLNEQPHTYADFEISNSQNEYKSIEWPCRTDIYIENPYFLSLDSKGNLAIHILNSGQIFHLQEETFLCGTFSLDGKYILAITSQQELAIIDVFTLKVIRKKTIQNFDDNTTTPSYLTQIDKSAILIGSLVKSHHGIPTVDLLHCDLETENPIIVYRSVPMPYPSTSAEFCTPVFKTIHLTENNLLLLGHSEADYLYALDLENGESGPQRLDLGGHMARGFSVLKLRLAHEEGKPVLDENNPIAHLPNLPRVLALDSSGELHQFRFSTSRLLPGDFPLPSEPLKLGEFKDLPVQPTVFIKHLFNEPSMFTIINEEEEEEEENILSRKNIRSPEQFISPERKNIDKTPEIPSFNEGTREDQAGLWRRQQFETPSFEASPLNLGPSKGNNLLSGFKNGQTTETQKSKMPPSVTDLKSREPSTVEIAISKEREERVKESEKRIIRKKDIFQGNPTEGYQNHIKCLLEDAKEVIEASKKIKTEIGQRNLDSLQRIIRTLNKGNSYCETALDEAQETFNQKNTETSSQSQNTPKEEQKLKNLIESYQQRLSLMNKNLAPLDLFVDNNQMILSVAPTTEVRRIDCSSATTSQKKNNNEKSKTSQSLGRKGLVSSFQMSLKDRKQPESKKEPSTSSRPLFDDEHEEMMEQRNQKVYERQERIMKTLHLLNYLLNQKTTVIDNLQQSLEKIRKDSSADKTSKQNRGIYYDDSSDEENKVPRKQKFQTVPANPFEITLQQPNKFTGSQHRDQFLKDLLTHLSTRNSKHEMVLLKSYSTSMAKTDPSLYKFVDHLHLDEDCAAPKKAINQGLSDILTKAREKKREDERIAEQKRKEEEERRRKEEEERKRKEEEERKRKEAEEKKRQEEARKKAEEEAKKKAAEDAARKKAAEEEAKKKAAEQAAAAAAAGQTDANAGGAAPAQGQAQGGTNEHIEKYMKNQLEMSSAEIGGLNKMKQKLAVIMEQMKQANINPAAAIFILTIQNLPPAWDTDKLKAQLTSSQKKFDAVKVAATSDNKKYAQVKVTGFDDAQKYILLDGQTLEGHALDVTIKLSEKTAPGAAPTQGQGQQQQQQQQQAQVKPTPQKTTIGGIGNMGNMGGGMGGLNLGGNKGMTQQQGGGNMFQTGGQTQNTQATGGAAFGQSGGMGMGMGNKPTGVAFGQTGGMGGGTGGAAFGQTGGMGGGTGGATFGKPAFGGVGGGQALGGRPAFGQTGGMMGQGQGQGMKTGGGFGAGTNTGGGGFMGMAGAVQQNKPAGGGVSFGTSGGGTGSFGGSSAMFGAARK